MTVDGDRTERRKLAEEEQPDEIDEEEQLDAVLQAAAKVPRWTSQERARTLFGEPGLAACGARLAPILALQELLPPGQLQIPSFSEPCLTTGIGCDANNLHFHVLANIGRLLHPRNRLTVNTFMMMR